jgi:hypothetical protein
MYEDEDQDEIDELFELSALEPRFR